MSSRDVTRAPDSGTGPGGRESAFGALVAASDVEMSIAAQVQLWIADYLADVERQHGLDVGYLPYPRAYVISSEVEKMPEDQLPAILVASPGLTDPPRADGSGVYTARWRVIVAVHIAARGNMLALRLARLYVLALRALLLQQQELPGLALRRIDWTDERYDTLPSIDDRTICTALVELGVAVAGVTTRHAGPLTPVMPPGQLGPDSPVWPLVDTHDVDVIKEPID